MPALTLYALASLPSVALTGMTEGTHYLRVNSAHPLRVRLQAAGDAGFYGSVRPTTDSQRLGAAPWRW